VLWSCGERLAEPDSVSIRIIDLHFVHAPGLASEFIPEGCSAGLELFIQKNNVLNSDVAATGTTDLSCFLFRPGIPEVDFYLFSADYQVAVLGEELELGEPKPLAKEVSGNLEVTTRQLWDRWAEYWGGHEWTLAFLAGSVVKELPVTPNV
jgi:hypothetical protein